MIMPAHHAIIMQINISPGGQINEEINQPPVLNVSAIYEYVLLIGFYALRWITLLHWTTLGMVHAVKSLIEAYAY